MDKIYVTPNMKERILENVNAEIDKKYSPIKIYYKSIASVTACAVFVIGKLT